MSTRITPGSRRAMLHEIRRQYAWDGSDAGRWSKKMLALQGASRADLKQNAFDRLRIPPWIEAHDLKVEGESITVFDLLIMPPYLLDDRLSDGTFLCTPPLGGRVQIHGWSRFSTETFLFPSPSQRSV